MSRLAPAGAMVCAALAAWLSRGTIASTGAATGRIGLLPLGAGALVVVLATATVVYFAARRRPSIAPYALLVMLLLPWVPGPLPSVLLMWTGPLAALVWLAIALSILFAVSPRLESIPRPRMAAGVLAFAIYAVAAWQVAPSVPGGDEPHYLIITQSLLNDGDLAIENNHQRGDYLAYFPGDLARPDYRRRGRNGEIYSIHAPGLPALVAPAFALGGYHGVVVFLILLAACGSALTWHLAWRLTGSVGAAWFGWAAVVLSTSNIFHAFSIYPDGPGGVIALTGAWALVRAEDEAESGVARVGPWWLHGAALALLPWLHTRFALIAASFGALVLLRLSTTQNAAGKAVAFLTVPAVSALAWIGSFIAIYGTPDPSAPYANEPGSAAFIAGGLAGLLFDQRFGLLAYSPVLLFGFVGLGAMIASRERRRLGLELLFVVIPYLLAVTHFAMWWGGRSAPARFFVPLLLLMAIPSAAAWSAIRHRATRATAAGALAFTAFASSVLVFAEGGRLAYNTRDAFAAWLAWLNPSLDLAHGLPAWWRETDLPFFRDIAIWCGVMAAAWTLLGALDRSPWLRSRAAFSAAAAGIYAVAAMAAVSILWAVSAGRGADKTPAQLQVLRRLASEERVLTFGLNPFRRIPSDAVPAALVMEPAPSVEPGGAGRNDRPLFMLPAVPAGRYRLRPHASGAADQPTAGWLMIGIGRDQFALRTQAIGSPPEPIELDFPVDVRALVVRGDEQARRRVTSLTVEPLSVVRAASRLTPEYARQAVRYGESSVFFLDDRSFPEPEAFWVGGSRSSSVVLQPDARKSMALLFLRNAPVENRVTIEAGTWREEIQLGAGEERTVTVPLDASRGATLIRFSVASGFRPSDVNSNSRDNRVLGVWVKLD